MNKKQKTNTILVIAALIALGYIYWLWNKPDNYVRLKPYGKVVFYQGNVFYHDEYELKYLQHEWHLIGEEHSLAVPFECSFNDTRNLHIDENGKVWVIINSESVRYELRVVNGNWSFNA